MYRYQSLTDVHGVEHTDTTDLPAFEFTQAQEQVCVTHYRRTNYFLSLETISTKPSLAMCLETIFTVNLVLSIY